MNLLSTIVIEEFCCLTKLGTSYDRVVDHKEAFIFDQFMYWDQLHSGDKISLALLGRHKRSWPCGRIFNKRTGKRHTRAVSIADGMCNTGIRYSCNQIRIHFSGISSCQNITAFVTHFLYIYSLISGGWISIIYPEERTDSHLVSWLLQNLCALRGDKINLSRSQLFQVFIAKINVGMTFKRSTTCIFLFADYKRSSSITVACCVNALPCHKKKGHRALDHFLGIADSLNNTVFLIDQRCSYLCRIHTATAHLQKMGMPVFEAFLYQSFYIIDLAYCCNCKISQMGAHQKRLRFIVRNTAYSKIAFHLCHIFVKFGTEW